RPARVIAGIPASLMYPIWETTPRYLRWLAGQGHLGAIHPWVAIVAADLSRRIRWRHLAPRRGAGRLLWMCEQMATPLHAADAVPTRYAAATGKGIPAPDWTASARPTGCRLDAAGYTTLLRDRATGTHLTRGPEGVKATAPPGATVTAWTGTTVARDRSSGEPHAITYPPTPTNPRVARPVPTRAP